MDEISILKAFFERAEEVGFDKVSYVDLEQDLGLEASFLKDQFPTPIDFLKALLKNLEETCSFDTEDLSELSLKERLFECFMSRLEALTSYQGGLKRLILDLESGTFGGKTISFLSDMIPFLLKSMGLILKKVGREAQMPKKMALLVVYSLTLRVWARDKTGDLSQTLQALDRSLDLLILNYEGFS